MRRSAAESGGATSGGQSDAVHMGKQLNVKSYKALAKCLITEVQDDAVLI